MTCDPSIESTDCVARFTRQPDAVLVLAYGGETGGCGGALLELLEEWAQSLPVLVVQADEISSLDPSPPFQGNAVQVLAVPPDPGPSQSAAIASAMRDLAMQAPVLILLNPLFAPFWERAFGVCRLFAVTQAFKSDTQTARQENEDFDRLQRNQILLLERSVHSVLLENGDDLEWLRDEFVYRGQFHPVRELLGDAAGKLVQLAEKTLGQESRFPHRLDILLLVDPPQQGQSLPPDSAAAHYQRSSRHRVYFALKRSQDKSEQITTPPDYGDFDVLLIERANDSAREGRMEPAVIEGVRQFCGLKGVLGKESDGANESLAKLSAELGLQVQVSQAALGKGQTATESLDTFFSSLMPGLPNWQLHQVGKFLPHMAWTDQQLLEKYANGELDLETPIDPIEELRSLERQKQKLEEELDEMRGEIASLDGQIVDLEKQWQLITARKAKQQRKPGLLKKILSRIKGKGAA